MTFVSIVRIPASYQYIAQFDFLPHYVQCTVAVTTIHSSTFSNWMGNCSMRQRDRLKFHFFLFLDLPSYRSAAGFQGRVCCFSENPIYLREVLLFGKLLMPNHNAVWSVDQFCTLINYCTPWCVKSVKNSNWFSEPKIHNYYAHQTKVEHFWLSLILVIESTQNLLLKMLRKQF